MSHFFIFHQILRRFGTRLGFHIHVPKFAIQSFILTLKGSSMQLAHTT